MKKIKQPNGTEEYLDDNGNVIGMRIPMFAMDSLDPVQQAVAVATAVLKKPSPRDEYIKHLNDASARPTRDDKVFARPTGKRSLADFMKLRDDVTTKASSATYNNPTQAHQPEESPKTDPSFPSPAMQAYAEWKEKVQHLWGRTWNA